MEMSQVAVKNFKMASYNRFNSCEDNDGQDEDSVTEHSFRNITPEGNPTRSRYYRFAAVCLTMLCLLLISTVSVLWVKFSNLTTKNNDLQTRYSNLILEKDQLQTSYTNATFERDQLYHSLNRDKDQLQTRFNKLTAEKDQLQSNFYNLTVERDQLQSNFYNLAVERDQLQSSFYNLTVKKDQLQTLYNNMTVVRDKDQVKYAEMAEEMKKLQANYTTVANKKDQLQKEIKEIQNMLTKTVEQSRQGWLYFNYRLFFISTEKKSWTESRQECKKNGGDLAIIKTNEEQDFLVQQLGNDRAWIGLNDRSAEGVWKWVDGTALTNKHWAPGEPNNVGNEDCAEIWGFQGKQGWNDVPCGDKVKWICGKLAQWYDAKIKNKTLSVDVITEH